MRTFPLASYTILSPRSIGGLSRSSLAERTAASGTECVVLKQLLPPAREQGELALRWLEVAEQNHSITHPGCARVLDWGQCEGEAYVAVEYVSGTGLAQILRGLRQANERVSVAVAIHIARETLDALASGHARTPPLSHLDVATDSILVSPAGTIKLTEFGLWSVLDPAEVARRRFDRGRVNYLAPEQSGSRPGDARSDLFSVGVMLYELLAGERPFVGATQLAIAMAIAGDRRKPLREAAPLVPAGLQELVERLLAHEPLARFQDAREALAALDATGLVSAGAALELTAVAMRFQAIESPGLAHPSAGGRSMRSPPAWAAAAPIPRGPQDARTSVFDPLALQRSTAAPKALPEPQPIEFQQAGSIEVRDTIGSAIPREQRAAPVPPPLLQLSPPGGPVIGRALPDMARHSPPAPALVELPARKSCLAAPSSLETLPPRVPAATPVASFALVLGEEPPCPPMAPAATGHARDERWCEPSATLFQPRRFARGTTSRTRSPPHVGLAVTLAAIFGFTIFAGGYLLHRLL